MIGTLGIHIIPQGVTETLGIPILPNKGNTMDPIGIPIDSTEGKRGIQANPTGDFLENSHIHKEELSVSTPDLHISTLRKLRK